MTKKEKFNAVIRDILESHEKRQPVLVGTITIETSELVAKLLEKNGIPRTNFAVLNAKFHEKEAEIISHAGEAGAITIATNMAGRGTDIKLDDEARAAGGLKVIGTERHESRRIDNQLRGRSGRQGDPGESRFYISLEDDLMRLFGSEKLMNTFRSLGVQEGEQIEHKMLSSAIERAQKKIESNNFGIRKNLLDYDLVNNEQREIVYADRRRVLDGDNMRDSIMSMISSVIERSVDTCISDDVEKDEWDIEELNRILLSIIPMKKITKKTIADIHNKAEFKQLLKEKAVKLYAEKEAEFPDAEQMRAFERVVLLRVIDQRWMNHIDDMEQLRQGIGLQAYGQRDPKVEYKMIAYDMFDEMNNAIQENTVRILYHVRVVKESDAPNVQQPVPVQAVPSANRAAATAEQAGQAAASGGGAPLSAQAAGAAAAKPSRASSNVRIAGANFGPEVKITGTNRDDSSGKKPVVKKRKKIYPNDPCPCGSGKKYKQCHGRPGAGPLPDDF
jgi:preprotein translocase subunit SecA